MDYIASVFASRALALAAGSGHKPRARARGDALLASAGILRSQLAEPEGLIDDSRFFNLLEAIADSTGDGRYIGIRIGAAMRCDDYGAFGLAFKSSVDLRGSFQRVERFGRVVTNVANFTVTRGRQTTWMSVPATRSGRPGELMTNELALAAATSLSREVAGRTFAPTRVSFQHAAPEERRPMDTFFGCPVAFNADRNGLELDNQILTTANTLGDAKISEFFDRHLDGELRERTLTDSLEGRVLKMITPALSEGTPRIEDIAHRLGMSRRTLQRRLAEQDVAFLELLDRARRELVYSLLRTPRYRLSEIAFLAGYADQSAFSRAFRRWEGQTPAEFRRAAGSGG